VCTSHTLHWRKAVKMAKMLINLNDASLIAAATTFVVGIGAVKSGRTAPIFRQLKR